MAPSEWGQMYELVERSFGIGQDYFRMHAAMEGEVAPYHHCVAVNGERLVAHAVVYPKKMRLQDRTVTLGNVANVCTDPEYRKRGIASRVMRELVAHMKREQMHLSVLGGAPRFYGRFGYQAIAPQERITLKASSIVETPHLCATLDDLPWMAELYDHNMSPLDTAIVRDVAYWQRITQQLSYNLTLVSPQHDAYCIMTNRHPQQASICDVQANNVSALKRMLLATLDSSHKRAIETVDVSHYKDPDNDLVRALEQLEGAVVDRGETCGPLWSRINLDFPKHVNFHIAGGDVR